MITKSNDIVPGRGGKDKMAIMTKTTLVTIMNYNVIAIISDPLTSIRFSMVSSELKTLRALHSLIILTLPQCSYLHESVSLCYITNHPRFSDSKNNVLFWFLTFLWVGWIGPPLPSQEHTLQLPSAAGLQGLADPAWPHSCSLAISVSCQLGSPIPHKASCSLPYVRVTSSHEALQETHKGQRKRLQGCLGPRPWNLYVISATLREVQK